VYKNSEMSNIKLGPCMVSFLKLRSFGGRIAECLLWQYLHCVAPSAKTAPLLLKHGITQCTGEYDGIKCE